MKTITEQEAKSQKLRKLTNPYSLPAEQWMLENVLNDMRRGKIEHALVGNESSVEVWRS